MNNSWDEHRLLVLANFERHENDIKAMKKEVQTLRDRLKDQNWKLLFMAVAGGIGGGGGVDLLKVVLSGLL